MKITAKMSVKIAIWIEYTPPHPTVKIVMTKILVIRRRNREKHQIKEDD
jgi:hypothetical protein